MEITSDKKKWIIFLIIFLISGHFLCPKYFDVTTIILISITVLFLLTSWNGTLELEQFLGIKFKIKLDAGRTKNILELNTNDESKKQKIKKSGFYTVSIPNGEVAITIYKKQITGLVANIFNKYENPVDIGVTINNHNGNSRLYIPAGVSGIFENTSDTDTFSDEKEIGIRISSKGMDNIEKKIFD